MEQRVQHVEAGLVGGEPGALDLHAVAAGHRAWKCARRLSWTCVTAAAPPSAATMWLRIG
jgi:hypothetical protein